MPERFAPTCHGPQARPVLAARRRATRGGAVRGAMIAGMLLAGPLLAACSSISDTGFSLFADPGKYQFHNCKQIAAEMTSLTRRRQDLKALMDRADRGAVGSSVSFIAYKGDYVNAGEELELLQSAARSKKCEQDETWRSSTAIR
jgi:hypothetical protein